MRTYRKVYINENLDVVSHRPTNACKRAIALRVPFTTNQIVTAYNFLSAGFVPRTDFGGAVWKLYDGSNVLQATFSGIQLANDVFTFVDYKSHPRN